MARFPGFQADDSIEDFASLPEADTFAMKRSLGRFFVAQENAALAANLSESNAPAPDAVSVGGVDFVDPFEFTIDARDLAQLPGVLDTAFGLYGIPVLDLGFVPDVSLSAFEGEAIPPEQGFGLPPVEEIFAFEVFADLSYGQDAANSFIYYGPGGPAPLAEEAPVPPPDADALAFSAAVEAAVAALQEHLNAYGTSGLESTLKDLQAFSLTPGDYIF
jgi:hypothetical protein